MKKLSYLILLVVILGLALTGCLLSNVGQVPTTEQSGITYLTKSGSPPNLVNLVGLWHFDTDANDSTVNHNDGTFIGDAYLIPTGYFGNALSLDGTEDYVSVADSTSLDITTGLTIEAWVHTDVSISGSTQMQIVDKGEHSSSSAYMLMIYNGDLYGRVNKNNATACIYTSYPNDGEWHHVAYTFKSGEQELYIDGSNVVSNTGSATITLNSYPLLIGRGVNRPQYCWNGEIDEVRIWDGALTTEQIEDSFNYGIVIQKGMSQDDAVLGDIITTTLEVATATAVTVEDTLPAELRYIPGTFEVNGVAAIPTVVGQTISYNLPSPCAYTIIFDAQVTSAEVDDITVTNTVAAGDASASAELTIHPYEGFTKVADGDMTVEVGEEVAWNVTITVENILNDAILYMEDIVVKDRFGGELEIDEYEVFAGLLEVTVSGKTAKPKIKWDDFSLVDGAFKTADLTVSTDENPGGQHSYSTAGEYEMNSGAVLKFIDSEGTGFQLSAHTPQITVEVKDPD